MIPNGNARPKAEPGLGAVELYVLIEPRLARAPLRLNPAWQAPGKLTAISDNERPVFPLQTMGAAYPQFPVEFVGSP